MDERRGTLNVDASMASGVVLLIVTPLVRRLYTRYIGNDGNGSNGLLASMIGVLGVAEPGIG